jgi:hypothetical protein
MVLAGGPSTSSGGSVRIMWHVCIWTQPKKRAIGDVAVGGMGGEESCRNFNPNFSCRSCDRVARPVLPSPT